MISGGDQADGLRKLVGGHFVRVLALAGGLAGVGKTSVAVNLAFALARRGKKVLILDHAGGAAPRLGLAPRHDLADALESRKPVEEVALEKDGVFVVSCTGAKLRPAFERQELLVDFLRRIAADVVLANVGAGTTEDAVSLSLAAQETVLVLSPRPRAITATYALAKVLAQGYGQRRFRVLLSRVEDESQGEAVFHNVAEASRQFLAVRPLLMGSVPEDSRLAQAESMRRSVGEAFPDSPSAAAFRKMAEATEDWPRPAEADADIGAFVARMAETGRITHRHP